MIKEKNVTDGKKLFKSAVAEHVAETYDVTGWEDDKIIDRESHRGLKEYLEKRQQR